MSEAAKLEELEQGDKILFNDRKTALEVEKVEEEAVLVKGPQGGKYEIYPAEDTDDLLFSKRGNRRYSSYCRDLRKVGEWKKESEEFWKHSMTEAEIRLEKNEIGYWQINSTIEEESIESPKYGYSDREEAEKEVRKIMRKNPEG